jgi:integrase
MRVPTMKNLDDAHMNKIVDRARSRHHHVMLRFLVATQKAWHTPVSDVFDGTFSSDVKMFVASKHTKAIQDEVRKILRSWETDAKKLISAPELPPDPISTDTLPADFGDALQELMVQAGATGFGLARTICKETGERAESVATLIEEWVRHGCFPSPQMIPRVERIEDALQVSRGTLTSRMSDFVHGIKERYHAKTGRSPFTKRLCHWRARSYAVGLDTSSVLKAEWDDFFRFKTAKVLKEGERRQGQSRWRVRGDKCASGRMAAKSVALFLGFLHKEKSEDPRESGLAIPKARLSMALLSVPSSVISYISDFRAWRSEGVYHHGFVVFLQFCRHLVRKETGYLTQYPDLFARKVMFTEDWQQWIRTYGHGRKNPPVRIWWKAWCERAYLQYDTIVRDWRHNKSLGKSRDPMEPIQAILKLDHPMEVLFAFLEDMKKRHRGDEKSASPERHALKYRDLLLIKLLSVNPLRARNLSELTWRPDNTGHLQKTNGVWSLRIRQDEFKNWYYRPHDKDYTVPLPPDCNEYIERYLDFRRHLKNADRCDLLFLPLPCGANKKSTRPGLSPMSVSRLVSRLTRSYIPEELAPAGFGPHAFRHIIAHSYLKHNPTAYVVVADILNDTPRTVMQTYGHIETAHNFRHWLSFYAEEQERIGARRFVSDFTDGELR